MEILTIIMDNEKVIYKDSSGILFSNGQSCIYRSHGNEISFTPNSENGCISIFEYKDSILLSWHDKNESFNVSYNGYSRIPYYGEQEKHVELIKAEDSLIYEEAIPFNDNAKHRIVYNMKRKKEEHYVINQSLIIQLDKFAKFDTYSDFNSFSVIYEIDSDIVIHYEKAKHITNSMGLLMPDYKEERIKNVKKWGRLTKKRGETTIVFPIVKVETEHDDILISLISGEIIQGDFKETQITTKNLNNDLLYYQRKEYVLVDNSFFIYTAEEVFDCTFKNKSKLRYGTLLDTFLGYAAFEKEQVLRIIIYEITDRGMVLRYPSYYYKYGKEGTLIICDNRFRNMSIIFNIESKRFSYEFDEDFVKKKGLIRIDDNYTILDALEGEHDAYWNID